MVIYDSADKYIESCTSLQDKITAIDAIITGLLSAAAKAAANDNISEYSINDGQVQIKSVYRGAAAVMNSIKQFEALKQFYVNQLNGRIIRLVDGKNF